MLQLAKSPDAWRLFGASIPSCKKNHDSNIRPAIAKIKAPRTYVCRGC